MEGTRKENTTILQLMVYHLPYWLLNILLALCEREA
jgi:hypothetical protein